MDRQVRFIAKDKGKEMLTLTDSDKSTQEQKRTIRQCTKESGIQKTERSINRQTDE